MDCNTPLHRLLKNDIDKHEYLLLTENLTTQTQDWKEQSFKSWADVQSSSQLYDSGKVNYSYLHLDPLYTSVPELKAEDFRLKGHTVSVLKSEAVIDAPLDLVFDVVTDVNWRGKWIPGTMPETTDVNSYFSQTGQSHKCIANGPVMFMHDFHQEKDKVFFSETANTQSHSCVFTLTKIDENKTLLENEFFMSKNFFKQLMFSLLMKKKFEKLCMAAWENLNAYCKGLVEKKQKHPYNIVLKSEPVAIKAVA